MQGQDQRKVGKSLKDLTLDPSDTGVATFQDWLQTIASGGPFAGGASSSITDNSIYLQDYFSRELSFWENHGKYCPRCQRSMRRVSRAQKLAARWSSRLMIASIVASVLAGGTCLTAIRGRITKTLLVLTINLLVFNTVLRHVADWCRQKEKRMNSVGADLWPPQESVFGYQSRKQ